MLELVKYYELDRMDVQFRDIQVCIVFYDGL